MSSIELMHLTFSHFNEKARWALDLKKVEHTRRGFDVLGPHEEPARALTGATEMPILVVDGKPLAGSANILAWLDEHHPDPPLLPEDPGLRDEALELQRYFDEVVGPAVRFAFVIDLVADVEYTTKYFLGARAAHIKVPPGAEVPPREKTLAALDLVAERGKPYLVGDSFSIADLTAAAILSMVLYPPGFPFEVPHRDRAPTKQWFQRYEDHPGTAWVRRMYEQHRP